MKIQLIGVRTPFFKKIKKVLAEIITQYHLNATIESIEDIDTILNMGTTAIPAVAIDGEIVISYTFPHEFFEEELKNILLRQKMDLPSR